MAIVMKASEFVDKLNDVVKNYKTLYVMGCFGAPMTDKNKTRYCKNHDYNKKPTRTAMIKAASADTFGFDCVCLIKGILWGWNGDKTKTYGGAQYATKGVSDTSADGRIKLCEGVTTDFSNIQVGEAVWCKGHIGVYIGDGLAIECTPAWKNCVQVTAVKNIGTKSGYNARTWTKHGKLPYIEYDVTTSAPSNTESNTEVKNEEVCNVEVKVLKKGSEGKAVEALQALLIANGHSCGIAGKDGEFGSTTEKAVKAYQKAHKLTVDGIVGPATWGKLLGVK
jgi:hypothetical protein